MSKSKKNPEDFEVPVPTWEKWEAEATKEMPWPLDSKKYFQTQELDKQVMSEMKSAPYDARFPQVNRSRQCMVWFVDYHRCTTLLGEDYKPCKFFKDYYKDICPKKWTEKFDDWIDRGIFPARFDR